MLKKHSSLTAYKQNFRAEGKSPDGRIPDGGWEHWLERIGFSEDAVAHIMTFGAKGEAKRVSQEEAAKIVNT